MNPAAATREVLWNISHVWLMYVMFALSLLVAAGGIYTRLEAWLQGQPASRFDQPFRRLLLLLKHVVGQQRTVRERYAAIFHTFIFTGFIILTVATTVVMLHHDFGLEVMSGAFYLYFQSFIVDVFGALALVGTGIAAWRRFSLKPKKLVYTNEAALILAAIFLIVLTGFLIEGWRIAATDDPWGAWSPFGYLVALISKPLMGEAALRALHRGMWWTHAVMVFGFIAWAPYTKMIHAVLAPLNIYTASLVPSGASLKPIDFERAETLGVKTLAGFTWKDLLDFDSCTECGRCTAVCPANAVGKSLSPRDIIIDLRNFMHGSPFAASGNQNGSPGTVESAIRNPQSAIIGAVPATSPDALWSCTTCGACVEACPVFIEQMPKIVDMRRYLVMEEADFPETMQEAITSLESRGHPFRGTQASRLDWAEGLNVRTLAEARNAEVILWVGCGGALIERNQKVTRAVAQLLTQAGVNFAILGREEKCTGDPARRIGNEFLFETLAKENTAMLNRYGVKQIVTSCPHCFNTFRHEYPQFGGHYEVWHHSEFLARLIDEGRLSTVAKADRTITFHDPCYLGRHNGVYDAPRRLVQIASKSGVVEMEQNRNNSFCCGGGGGMSFVEEPPDKRVNQERARQALETGADVVAVGCPFCMTMLEDGINARKGDRDVRVMDVAEVLWQAVQHGNQGSVAHQTTDAPHSSAP
ncbi:MAG TPA: heterodisulfide reductase-related iron-sulfur binding cluster [Blastocatellia bacterium]|nr:heterodisulfide reductase-related iron-sulfur binding cluster [Blastocatellia bacterium]